MIGVRRSNELNGYISLPSIINIYIGPPLQVWEKSLRNTFSQDPQNDMVIDFLTLFSNINWKWTKHLL